MDTTNDQEKIRCTGCNNDLVPSWFHRDNSTKSTGRKSRCKRCEAQADRDAGKTTAPMPNFDEFGNIIRKHPAPPPAPEPVKELTVEEEIWLTAVGRLIERHRSDFNALVYTERVRLGLVEPRSPARAYGWRDMVA